MIANSLCLNVLLSYFCKSLILTSEKLSLCSLEQKPLILILKGMYCLKLCFSIRGPIRGGSDRPKQCFTVLPEPNKSIKVLFPEPKLNRTEHVKSA